MARKRIVFIVAWALSLIIVAVVARAQTPTQRGPAPTIITGNDLGFRIERQQANRVVGTFVVRINGEWVAAEPAAGAKALTLK